MFIFPPLHIFLLLFFSFGYFVPIFVSGEFWVSGKIFCITTNEPANRAEVKLMEDDSGLFGNDDDFLGYAESNEKGEFIVYGSTEEVGDEELYLLIYHRCLKDALDVLPKSEFLSFLTKIKLETVLNDDGPFKVNDLEIHLGGKSWAKSGGKSLPIATEWDPYKTLHPVFNFDQQ